VGEKEKRDSERAGRDIGRRGVERECVGVTRYLEEWNLLKWIL
jgi:hypothetical protein